jgi:diadenosine tetraphosphatase ApaH/serine/threonine PP2A family protein phosphatase
VHFVNTGSVGRPKDGDWRAGYVVVSLGEGDAGVEFVRVEYDVKKAADAIRATDLPLDFATFLERGGKAAP